MQACFDKEINKKIVPFATVYTMDVLEGVFGQKQMKTDNRTDDSYISDGGEPTPPSIDNVANRLTMITDKSALILHSEMTRPILPQKQKRGQSEKRRLKLAKASSSKSSKKPAEEDEKEATIADSG